MNNKKCLLSITDIDKLWLSTNLGVNQNIDIISKMNVRAWAVVNWLIIYLPLMF